MQELRAQIQAQLRLAEHLRKLGEQGGEFDGCRNCLLTSTFMSDAIFRIQDVQNLDLICQTWGIMGQLGHLAYLMLLHSVPKAQTKVYFTLYMYNFYNEFY